MSRASRLFFPIFAALVVSTYASTSPAQEAAKKSLVPRALFNYVAREEKVFAWNIERQHEVGGGKIYDVQLTSQQWQGVVWKHVLQIYEPAEVKYPRHVLLFVTGGRTGGKPRASDMQRGLALAKLCAARVATIHQVPNQPLFDDRVEDDLITETWLKYLKTGDETWPLLFPMVKSAVKAMDAIQEIAKQQWKEPVEGFVITGGSKRGWTSWLTPVADERVIATAPLVIDVLNFRAQMKHQRNTWGKYSEQIHDYSSKGLIVEGKETPREMKLRQMMDPFTYRDKLTLPKLLVNGTNDPYWVVDAMKWYWDDLKGPKYVLQVPNAGHGLNGGQQLALSTVSAFFQHAALGEPLPELRWKHSVTDDAITLQVTSSKSPKAERLWVADSQDKDFRDETWEPQPLVSKSNTFVGRIAQPASGYIAQFAELQFEINGVPYSLCTLVYRE